MDSIFGLSKSKIAAFEQCEKRLWLQVHRPESAELNDSSAAGFAAGHKIGAIACSLLPDGLMVEAEPDLKAALTATERLLREGQTVSIFEATFSFDGVLVRADILESDGSGGWKLREVKSSTRAKDHHLSDLATQVWVARRVGLRVTSAAVRHINSSFVLSEVGNFDGLFNDEELLEQIDEMVASRHQTIADARKSLGGGKPAVQIGKHCGSPYNCEFSNYCSRDLPPGPEWPVDLLPNGGGRKWLAAGINDIMSIDASQLHGRDGNIVRATQSSQPYHDVEEARRAINAWAYPRAWIDFETIAFPVPRWVGTRPYEQVPFQFSLHVEEEDGKVSHSEFLHLDGDDPRHACAEALVSKIPNGATLVAYNAAFEKRVLLSLSDAVPMHAKALRNMADSIVDLLPVTRNTWYHRDQRGSWSIKAVLPTLVSLNYEDLEVRDGSKAQQAYLEAIDPLTAPVRKLAIDSALRAYCERDTWAMVAIARALTARP